MDDKDPIKAMGSASKSIAEILKNTPRVNIPAVPNYRLKIPDIESIKIPTDKEKNHYQSAAVLMKTVRRGFELEK
jgi:hypothetical protein